MLRLTRSETHKRRRSPGASLCAAGIGLAALAATAIPGTASAQDVLAYWNQNSNDLPGGGNGFLAVPDDFPQAADLGSGSLTVGGGQITDTVAAGSDTIYAWIQSFTGTTDNAQGADPSGGSIVFQGGADDGMGNFGNDGAYMDFSTSTVGYESIEFSYATRGTGTGFTDQELTYSIDGGSIFSPLDMLTTPSGWAVQSFSLPPDADDVAEVIVRVEFDGATSSSGNNRLDNITFTGTALASGPMAGDTCATAGVITADGLYPFDTTGASSDDVCYGAAGNYPTVWYAFTAPADGVVDYGLCGADFDSYIVVYEGTDCATLTCADNVEEANGGPDGCPDNTDDPAGAFEVIGGLTYYFSIQPFDFDVEGSGDLEFAFTAAGSECETPIAITGSGTDDYDNTTAPLEVLCAVGSSSGSPTVWYEYTFEEDGEVVVSLCNDPSFDSVMELFDDVCPDLGVCDNILAADDDTNCGITFGPSSLTFSGLAGESYLLAIAGWGSADTTTTTLEYTFTADVTGSDAGDTCETAGVIDANGTYPFDSTGASGDDPCFGAPTVWWEYTPLETSTVTFDTCGSSFDSYITIYQGASCPTSCSPIAENNDSCGTQSSVTFTGVAGQTYYISVNGFNVTDFGPGVLNVSGIVQPEAGDTCAEGDLITAEGSYPFDTTGASFDDPCAAGLDIPAVWYSFEAPEAGLWQLDLCGSSYDTFMIVYEGPDCPVACENVVAFNDDSAICGDATSAVVLTASAGDVFIVSINGFDSASFGPGALNVSYLGTGVENTAGDTCGTATELTMDGAYPFSTIGASGDKICGFAAQAPTVWYSFTAWASGTLSMDVCDADYDSELFLYTGPACPTSCATVVDGNDDSPDCGEAPTSALSGISVTAGEQYIVQISGLNGTDAGSGTFNIAIESIEFDGEVGSLQCPEATPVGPGATYLVDLTDAPDPAFIIGSGAPSIEPLLFENTKWLAYTPAEDGLATISLCDGTNYDSFMFVYDECPVGFNDDSNLLAFDDDGCGGVGVPSEIADLPVFAGDTIYISVAAFESASLGQAIVTIDGPAAQVTLNEIVSNTPGGDDQREYLELRGPAFGPVDGLTFLVIEGEGSGAGTIDQAVDLGSLLDIDGETPRFSAAGYLLLAGEEYLLGGQVPPDTRSIFPAPVTYETISTDVPYDFDNDLENGSQTYAVVQDFSGMAGDDLDGGNAGVLDVEPWAIVHDAVAYLDSDGELQYAGLMGGVDLGRGVGLDGESNFEYEILFRDIVTGDWEGGQLDDDFGDQTRATEVTVVVELEDSNAISDAAYAGLAGTPGFYNPLDNDPVAGEVLLDIAECGDSLIVLWDGFYDSETLVTGYFLEMYQVVDGDFLGPIFTSPFDANERFVQLDFNAPFPAQGTTFAAVVYADNALGLFNFNLNIAAVADVTPPVPAGATIDVEIEAPTFDVTLSDLSVLLDVANSTDNCAAPEALTVVDASQTTFGCADVAATLEGNPPVVTITVADEGGNTATTTATVNVFDNLPPTLFTTPTVASLDANGVATISVEDVVLDELSGDGCGDIILVSVVPDTFSCEDAAATDAGNPPVVIVTAEDASGNTVTGTTIVPVEDAVAPEISCAGTISVELDSITGIVSISSDDVFTSPASDNCGIADVALSRDTFDCADAAATLNGMAPVVDVTVTDLYGNQTSCSVEVQVFDVTAPNLVTASPVVILDANGMGSLAPMDLIDPSTSDNCSWSIVSVERTEFDCSDVGGGPEPSPISLGVPVSVTIEDPSGNQSSGTAFVEVIDDTAPVVNCPDPFTTVLCNHPEGFYFEPDVTDNCPWTYSIDGFPSAILPFGVTEDVVVRVYDSTGEEVDSCTFTIEVIGDVDEPIRVQSVAQFDGFLTRLSDTAVPTINTTATSMYVGDGTDNAESRIVMSMDTSVIPEEAIISSATLRFHRFAERGSSIDLGFLQVDILDPAGNTADLVVEDFDSVALGSNVGLPTPPPPSIGGGMFIGIVDPAFDLLDRDGLTRFRVQYPVASDFDGTADGLSFGSGDNGPFDTYSPELVVEYYLPACEGCGINDPFFAGPDLLGPFELVSIPSHDGFVGETYEEAGVGSFANQTSSVLNVGDTRDNAQYIGVLSFDTASLGLDPGDYIERAELRLSRASIRGDISNFGALNVDMRCLRWDPDYFGLSPEIGPEDFQAATFFDGVASVAQVGNSFDFSAELNEDGLANINRDGFTQFKLRFDVEDDNDGVADYIGFFSGDTRTSSRRPVLRVWVRPFEDPQGQAHEIEVEAPDNFIRDEKRQR